jgi:hypothetical protein
MAGPDRVAYRDEAHSSRASTPLAAERSTRRTIATSRKGPRRPWPLPRIHGRNATSTRDGERPTTWALVMIQPRSASETGARRPCGRRGHGQRRAYLHASEAVLNTSSPWPPAHRPARAPCAQGARRRYLTLITCFLRQLKYGDEGMPRLHSPAPPPSGAFILIPRLLGQGRPFYRASAPQRKYCKSRRKPPVWLRAFSGRDYGSSGLDRVG